MADPIFGIEIFKYFADIAEIFGSTGTTMDVPNWIFFWGVLFMSFAIIFSVIQRIHFFEDNRGAAFIVSVIMAIFVAANSSAVSVITSMFPSLGVIILVCLGVLILLVIFVPDLVGDENKMWMLGAAAVVFFLIFFLVGAFSSLGWDPGSIGDIQGIIQLAMFVGIIITITVIAVLFTKR